VPQRSLQRSWRSYIVVGWPQVFALLLLAAFAAQCLYLVSKVPLTPAEQDHVWSGRQQLEYHALPRRYSHTPLVNLAAATPLRLGIGKRPPATQDLSADYVHAQIVRLRWMVRSLFVLIGVLLGVSVWYVSRRLYGNAGGFVALSLYCFSPAMISHAAMIDESVPAAWGIFGIIFGAIAISHNLYAPWRKWRYRTVLLSVALALAVASHPAAMLLLPVAIAFMVYLAPGRRWATLFIVLVTLAIAAALVQAAYAFTPRAMLDGLDLRAWLKYQPQISRPAFLDAAFIRANFLPTFLLLFLAGIVTYVIWKRSRYFGNTAPLIVGTMLLYAAMITPLTQLATLWALPFVFVFTGGMWADLLELRQRKWILGILLLVLAENAFLCWKTVSAV
jgi:hypothetical protein